jgi:hypothetical protein
MSCVLRNARIPLFFNGKSNHIFIVWQHMVLLLGMIRHYEGKRNYRLFVDWLVEAYYLRTFLQLSQHVPHFTTLQKFHYSSEISLLFRNFTTLQKFTERITGTVLERIISSFIIVTKIGQLLFIGIDSFLWVQSNSCFTILYGKSKTYEK